MRLHIRDLLTMARPTRANQIQEFADEVCLDRVVHLQAVQEAWSRQPTPGELQSLAELFSVISDPTRLRIVSALATGRLCVCDLSATVGTSESATSHHLRLMRERGLVRAERDGRLVYYSLDDDHVRSIFRQGRDHVAHLETTRQ